MSGFHNQLCREDISDKIFKLTCPLIYTCDILKCDIVVPVGFYSDGASVPRVPIVFDLWGDRAHREAVLHDYLYCYDSQPQHDFDQANDIFLEAMTSRNVPDLVRYPMYEAVCMFGHKFYNKRSYLDILGDINV
jgi:hypothetical protein